MNNPAQRNMLLTTVIISGVAAMILLVAPVVVGQLIHEYGFTLPQAGYVIAVELAGISLASLPALWWMGRVNWRRAAYVAVAVMAAANVASIWAMSFHALFVMRLVAALAAGSLLVLSLAAIGKTGQQDRNFGFWVVGQLVMGAVGLAVMPLVLQHTGLWVFYAAVAAAIVALAPMVRYLPSGAVGGQTDAADAPSWSLATAIARAPMALLGILGIFSFYIVISGVWTYVERVGHAAGFTAPFIGAVLALATVMGIVGAAAATATAGRGRRSHMIGLGFALLLVSVFMLLGAPDTTRYASAVLIFKFTWTFALPFMLAAITAFDPSGKLIVLTNMVMGGGLAAGPALAAWLLGDGFSYDAVLLVLSTVGAMSAALMIYTGDRAAQPIRGKP